MNSLQGVPSHTPTPGTTAVDRLQPTDFSSNSCIVYGVLKAGVKALLENRSQVLLKNKPEGIPRDVEQPGVLTMVDWAGMGAGHIPPWQTILSRFLQRAGLCDRSLLLPLSDCSCHLQVTHAHQHR